MPTVIDELIIKLGLDSSGFQRQASSTQAVVTRTGAVVRRESRELEESIKKTQLETQKRMRQVEEVGRGAATGFSRLRHEVVGLLGAIAGAYGLQQFARNMTSANQATGYLAKTIGVSTEELSAWQEAAKRVGGSAEATGASMRTMSQEIQNYQKTNQSEMIPILNALRTMPGRSIDMTDEQGKARSVIDIYKGLSDRFSKMNLPRAVSWGASLGIDEGTVRLLSKGGDELDKLIAEMEKLGVVRGQDFAASVKLQKAWDDLQQAATKLGNSILTDLSPKIIAAFDAMTQWLVVNREWLQLDIESKFRAFIDILGRVAEGINSVVDFLGGWKTTTELIFGLWVASKILPMVTNVGLLAAAMKSLAAGTAAVDLAAGGSGIKWFLGALAGLAGALGLAVLGEEMLYLGTRIGPAGDPDEEKRLLGGSFASRFPGLRVNPDQPTADLSMTPAKRTLLDALSIGESGGSYTSKNPTSTAHGRYQFLDSTDAEVSARTGLPGQDPASQDKKGWYLAATTYQRNTGRDLEADVKAGGREAEIAAALKGVWPSLPGGTQQNTTPEIWLKRMSEANRTNSASTIRIPPTGPTFGPQMAPTSAIDPGMRFALRSPASAVDNSRSNTSSSETHIGAINVHTAATDADGISKGIGGALKKYAFVPQSNYGLA